MTSREGMYFMRSARVALSASVVLTAGVLAAPLAATAAVPAAAPTPAARADFDGDGVSDLAAVDYTVTADTLSVIPGARVTYSKDGLGTVAYHYGDPGLPTGIYIVSTLDSGDVNGDGYADLTILSAGGVGVVIPGSASGLDTSKAMPFGNTTDDATPTGYSAPVGDVNGDGYDDVVFFHSKLFDDAKFTTYFGSASGIAKDNSQPYDLAPYRPLPGASVGDFDNDGFDDIVFRAVGWDCVAPIDAGSDACSTGTVVFRGSVDGPVPSFGKAVGYGLSEADALGDRSATVADFNQDGFADYAAGNSGNRGVVAVYYGGSGGLSRPKQLFTAKMAGVGVRQSALDFFSELLAVGDVNADGYPDLAVESARRHGTVTILFGGHHGLTTTDALHVTGDQLGLPPADKPFDTIRLRAVLDIDGDGDADVLVQDPVAETVIVVPSAHTALLPASAQTLSGGMDYGDLVAQGRIPAYSPGGAAATSTSTSHAVTTHQLYAESRTAPAPRAPEPTVARGTKQHHAVRGDFNGDGHPDVVIGIPGADAGDVTSAGAIIWYAGHAHGIDRAHPHRLTAASPGIPGHAESGDGFGAMTAAGDFNADGYSDLAVTVANDTPGGPLSDNYESYGSVDVIFGGPHGLRGGGDGRPAAEQFQGESPSQFGFAGTFGAGLAAGDYNHDGYVDLVVTDAGYRADENRVAGSIYVLRGGADGMTTSARRAIHQLIGNHRVAIDAAATSGDVTGDGITDLVLAAYDWKRICEEDGDNECGVAPQHPAVLVVPGSSSGLRSFTHAHHRQLTGGPLSEIHAIAVGRVTDDRKLDVVAGLPHRDTGGSISLLPGRGHGRFGTEQDITQNTKGVPGLAERGDDFGWSLAVRDVNRDGNADLAVGAPFEDDQAHKPTITDCGQVTLLFGGKTRIKTHGGRLIGSCIGASSSSTLADAAFGWAVTLVDVRGNHRPTMLASAPGYRHGRGYVLVLPGRASGPSLSESSRLVIEPPTLTPQWLNYTGYALG
jgi:FG-GAP repeat protein